MRNYIITENPTHRNSLHTTIWRSPSLTNSHLREQKMWFPLWTGDTHLRDQPGAFCRDYSWEPDLCKNNFNEFYSSSVLYQRLLSDKSQRDRI